MPITSVSITKQLTKIKEKKDKEFGDQFNELVDGHAGVLAPPMLILRATDFKIFKEHLAKISAPNGPLNEIKFYFKDEQDEYYFANKKNWWAYYFLDKECAVAFLIAQEKLGHDELARELKQSLREY